MLSVPQRRPTGRPSRPRLGAWRAALAVAALASVGAAAPAGAAIAPSDEAAPVAAALADGLPTTAEFTLLPRRPFAAPRSTVAAVSTSPLAGFPLAGSSYAILSTGDSRLADDANTSGSSGVNAGGSAGGHRGRFDDVVTLRVDVDVAAPANCLSLDLRFLSEEFAEYVGRGYNDGFVAELGGSDFSSSRGVLGAPRNFALDATGRAVTVDTAELTSAAAAGTTYDGATPLLRASAPIAAPGPQSIYLSVFDQGDARYDSAVFLDRLRLHRTPPGGCRPGAADSVPPETSIAGPPPAATPDATPTFEFSSDEPGSTFRCSVDGGAFADCASPYTAAALAPGPHSFRVFAVDASGNPDATPAEHCFAVAAAASPGRPSAPATLPPPVLGRRVNVVPLRGDVYVSPPGRPRRGGRRPPRSYRPPVRGRTFVPLDAGRQIPVGSLVDTRAGRVRLTSATGRRRRTQSSEFYSGAFRVLQSRRRRDGGLTELRLIGAAPGACARPRQATAAARRRARKRRLWGMGRGRFRTRGRYAAAIVRGTTWLVEDRCDGTFVRVAQGRVAVRDLVRRRTVPLRAPSSYLARPPGR